MKTILPYLFLIFSLCACSKQTPSRSAALPDNVVSDKPIVLKEGQAVVLMKAGDQDLMIGASVVDGKLSVTEVDPKGRSVGVTWKDSETWETSTTVSDGQNHAVVMDKNMDGFADFRAETTPSGTRRFELKGEAWVELKSQKSSSEPARQSTLAARPSTPFPMHTVERDGRISAVIPLGKGKNLYLFGKKVDERFGFTKFTYTLEGKTIFSHNDKTQDGILDELEFREPPFSDMALFSLEPDGYYSRASKQRHDEVEKTERIYQETFERIPSDKLFSEEGKQAIEEADKKVEELSNP